MFKIRNRYEDFYRYVDYYDDKILDSGQIIKIEFQKDLSNSKHYYSIYLVVMNKRKSEESTYLATTGKDGLKGLIWAKSKIIEFEKFIKDKYIDKPIVIYCQWDNNRRRNVYERGLRSIGYKFNMVFGKKALCKTL